MLLMGESKFHSIHIRCAKDKTEGLIFVAALMLLRGWSSFVGWRNNVNVNMNVHTPEKPQRIQFQCMLMIAY